GGAVVKIFTREVGHGADVLVAPAREVDQDGLLWAHFLGQLHGVGHGVARFQRGDDAFGAAQTVEGGQRLIIGNANVLGAAQLLQPGVFGADSGVVQARADAVGFGDLAVGVLQDHGAVAVQYAAGAFLQRGGVLV